MSDVHACLQAAKADKTAAMRLSGLDQQLTQLKGEQAELTKQWEKEQQEMQRLQSIKNEVRVPTGQAFLNLPGNVWPTT